MFSFFNSGVSFLLLIILAKFILPDDYGRLSIFNTIVTFLGYFIALSTTGYESITFFRKNRREFTSDFTAIHIIATFVFLFFSIVILVGGEKLASLLSLSVNLLWVALVISYTGVYVLMILSYYRVRQKVCQYGIISCSSAALNFVLALFFVVIMNDGWVGRVYSQLLCSIMASIIALYLYRRYRLLNFSNQSRQRFMNIILWGVPLIPHMAAIWIRQGLDRYIIESSHSMTEVGLFSFALNLVNIIIIIGSSFNNSFSVEIYQVLSSGLKAAEKKRTLYRKSQKMIVVFLVATVVVVLGCTLLVPFALPTYSKALPYFMILSIYGFVQCLYFLVVNYLFYYKKNKEIMYTTFGTSIIHLLLSLLLTKYSLFYTCVLYVFIQILIVGTIYYRSRKVIIAKLI